MLKHIYYTNGKCLQPELNLEGLEHGKGKNDGSGCKICFMCEMGLDDVGLGDFECFKWHKWGLEVGFKIVSTFKFWFGSGNGFSTEGDSVSKTGTVSVGSIDDAQGTVIDNGLRLGDDTGILYVGIGSGINGGKQGGVFKEFEGGVFKEIEGVISKEIEGGDETLHKIFVVTELLLIDTFGFMVGAGVVYEVDLGPKSYDLFDNTLNGLLFNSVRDPLEVDVRNVFGLDGNTEVVFNLVWKIGNCVFKGAGK